MNTWQDIANTIAASVIGTAAISFGALNHGLADLADRYAKDNDRLRRWGKCLAVFLWKEVK